MTFLPNISSLSDSVSVWLLLKIKLSVKDSCNQERLGTIALRHCGKGQLILDAGNILPKA